MEATGDVSFAGIAAEAETANRTVVELSAIAPDNPRKYPSKRRGAAVLTLVGVASVASAERDVLEAAAHTLGAT